MEESEDHVLVEQVGRCFSLSPRWVGIGVLPEAQVDSVDTTWRLKAYMTPAASEVNLRDSVTHLIHCFPCQQFELPK